MLISTVLETFFGRFRVNNINVNVVVGWDCVIIPAASVFLWPA